MLSDQARKAELLSATRLMTYGVYALGALMVAVGLLFVGHGVPIVRMELGWTEIMGGSVAASAGCIVIVLGLVLHHLEAMRDTIDRLAVPLPTMPLAVGGRSPALTLESGVPVAELRPAHPLAPAVKRDRLLADGEEVRPEPALMAALHPAAPNANEPPRPTTPEPTKPEPILAQNAPAMVLAEKQDTAQGPAVVPPDPVTDPLADAPAAAPRPNYLASFLSRRTAGSSAPTPSAEPQPLPLSFETGSGTPGGRVPMPSRRTSIDLSSGWDEDVAEGEQPPPTRDDASAAAAQPEPLPHAEPEPEPADEAAPVLDEPAPLDEVDEAAADPLQPVVVGRYNAGAASYVMYSNGMIEVETEQGTHQFASMQDLKSFIERRDARVS